jgi:rhamnulokinase
MKSRTFIAIDLGAESGRVVAGVFDGSKLTVEEIHRFPNTPVKIGGSLHWDVLRLFSEMQTGLAAAARNRGGAPVSVGVDTWGVDYALIDRKGKLVSNPYHYRDRRTDGMMEAAFARMPRREIYEHTGIQFMFLNTLFQVLSEVVSGSPALEIADRLLFVPDLLHYWLAGAKVNERTIASTSQMYNPASKDWADPLLERLQIPRRLFGEIVAPGTVLGPVLPEFAEATGAVNLQVVAPGSHDTASAVAAVPAGTEPHAYLSSGTWSLMGIETAHPVITADSYEYSFTNEIGVFDTVRLLKNICGLWLLQECKRTWAARGTDLSYAQLTDLARQARPFHSLVDPDFQAFATPGDMPARLTEFCRRTGQPEPSNTSSTVRAVLESLAMKYRWVLEKLEGLAGTRLEVLHIVGGGTKNALLNEFAANAVGRPVITGPVEATSIGNILVQMVALGDLRDLSEGRELVRNSFETQTYEPAGTAAWDEAYERFKRIMDAGARLSTTA